MDGSTDGILYLLHFSRMYFGAQHYFGFTERTPEERLEDHRRGRGAKLTRMASKAGIGMEIVWTEPGSRSDERKVKKRKNHHELCPLCRKSFLIRKAEQRRVLRLSRRSVVCTAPGDDLIPY